MFGSAPSARMMPAWSPMTSSAASGECPAPTVDLLSSFCHLKHVEAANLVALHNCMNTPGWHERRAEAAVIVRRSYQWAEDASAVLYQQDVGEHRSPRLQV